MVEDYHKKLFRLMDELVEEIYILTEKFPKTEIFGLTSQLRRSALSVVLNYVEGYARQRKLVMKNFYEISYGSLKETKYLIYFSQKRQYLSKEKYDELIVSLEEIGKMLWGIISKI